MGAPKPWPTRWPEPMIIPLDPDKQTPPLRHPDYDVEDDPREKPKRLPEKTSTVFS